MRSAESPSTKAPLDDVVADLRELREQAGSPSYAELALRVARQRTARGFTEAEARVGRTTVYDAFRTGRRRVDLDLVLDLVRALGADDEVAAWRERCLAAQRQVGAPREVSVRPESVEVAVVEAPGTSQPEAATDSVPRPARFIMLTLLACVGINLLGRVLVDALHLSVFLDMSGTAVAAVLLGPWWGALVGVSTNVVGVGTSGAASLPFTLVNVAGALVWGYGYQRFGMGRSLLRFSALNVIAGVVCTVVATPILLLMFDGFTVHESSDVARTILGVVPSVTFAVLVSNLLLSVVDKLISGYLALVARELVGKRAVRERSD